MPDQKLLAQAEKLLDRGKLDEGIEKLRLVLKSDPKSEVVANKLARAYLENEQPTEAVAIFCQMASYASSANLSKKAVALYRQALGVDSKNIQIKEKLSLELIELGQEAEAKKLLQEVIHHYLPRKKYNQALNLIPDLVSVSPDDFSAIAQWIELLKYSASEEKIKLLANALFNAPGLQNSKTDFSKPKLKLESDVTELLQELSKWTPASSIINYCLGFYFFQTKQLDKSLIQIKEAYRRTPLLGMNCILLIRLLFEKNMLQPGYFIYDFIKGRYSEDKTFDISETKEELSRLEKDFGWLVFAEDSGEEVMPISEFIDFFKRPQDNKAAESEEAEEAEDENEVIKFSTNPDGTSNATPDGPIAAEISLSTEEEKDTDDFEVTLSSGQSIASSGNEESEELNLTTSPEENNSPKIVFTPIPESASSVEDSKEIEKTQEIVNENELSVASETTFKPPKIVFEPQPQFRGELNSIQEEEPKCLDENSNTEQEQKPKVIEDPLAIVEGQRNQLKVDIRNSMRKTEQVPEQAYSDRLEATLVITKENIESELSSERKEGTRPSLVFSADNTAFIEPNIDSTRIISSEESKEITRDSKVNVADETINTVDDQEDEKTIIVPLSAGEDSSHDRAENLRVKFEPIPKQEKPVDVNVQEENFEANSTEDNTTLDGTSDLADDLLAENTQFLENVVEDGTKILINDLGSSQLTCDTLMERAERYLVRRNFYLARKAFRQAMTLGADADLVKEKLRDIRRLELPESIYYNEDNQDLDGKKIADIKDSLIRDLSNEEEIFDTGKYFSEKSNENILSRVAEIVSARGVQSGIDLGVALHEMGLYDFAAESFLYIANIDTNHKENALYLAAQSYFSSAKYSEAASILHSLIFKIEDKDKLVAIFYLLGSVYEKLKKPVKSRAFFKKVAEIDKSFRNIQEKLSN